jgi:beta-glucosidase
MTYTIAKRREDYPDFGNYPGRPETVDFSTGNHNGIADYKEVIYVGYRHFDKKEIAPSFPFGHGLSYTTFAYANIKPSSVSMAPEDTLTVTADITNTGTRAGTEVVQLYIRANQPKIDRPMRELKGFARVELKPGETKPISISITARDLAYCDVPGKQWKADAGTYSLELGSSSRDLRATVDVKLSGDYMFPLPGLGAQAPKAPSLTGQIVATASSFAGDNTPDLAIDAEKDSRWESEKHDPQWLSVDLGQPTLLDHASIEWEAAHAKVYDLQVSDDGQQWTTVYTNADSRGGIESFSFNPVKARWVRLLCSKRTTEWGYSIFNFQVFPPDAK